MRLQANSKQRVGFLRKYIPVVGTTATYSFFFSYPFCLVLACSLEHLVKTSLQTSNIHNSNNKAITSEFLQPQQHQLQIQMNGVDGKRRSAEQHVLGTQTTGKLNSPKTAIASQVMLSSATGPITDL